MRKLACSILATVGLAGGSFTGAALAASPPSHPGDHASLDRSAGARDRSARHDSHSRDRSGHERQHVEARDH